MVSDFGRDVLVLGYDYEEVPLTEVLALAVGKYAVDRPAVEQLELALAAIREVHEAGLASAGRLQDGRLLAVPLDELEQRARDLFDGSWAGRASYVIWLVNTPAGEAIASAAPDDYDPVEQLEGRLPPTPRPE